MYAAFVKLLNMSAAGGILIAAVMFLRLALRKAPKKFICILWALAALRLICPFSVSSEISAYNYMGDLSRGNGEVGFLLYNGQAKQPQLMILSDTEGDTDVSLPGILVVWAAGCAGMVLYAALSYRQVHRWVWAAFPLERHRIYLCDGLPNPFILGVLRPIIYLPSTLDAEQQRSVIAHELAHIARLDHLWKPLGFGILSVHWFNPLVWAAFALFCRDIEMACDEKVISKMSSEQMRRYSEVLLTCSMPGKLINACPLAFGEVGVKQRIRGIANYRRPTALVIAGSLLVCMTAAAVFLTDPIRAETAAATTSGSLTFTLPHTLHLNEEGKIVLDGKVVGGTASYSLEEQPLTATNLLWMVDFPEMRQENIAVYAYTTEDSKYSLHFFSDVPDEEPLKVYSIHYLYPCRDGSLCDLWFDALHVDIAAREKILRTVTTDGRKQGSPFDASDFIQTGFLCFTAEDACTIRTAPSEGARELGILAPGDRLLFLQEQTIANRRWVYGYVRGKSMYGWLQRDEKMQFTQCFPVING